MIQAAMAVVLGVLVSASSLAGQVQGTIQMDRALTAKLKPSATLYIVARKAGAAGGMPLAVLRVPQPLKFPLDFQLTDANAMMPGTQLQGKVAISARINQSGSAGPAQPGDLEPSAPPVEASVGSAKKVVIKIDREK